MRSRYLIPFALLASAVGTIVVAQPAPPANADPAAVTAGSYVIEPSHTRLQFSLSHMGFTHWYGDLTGASGSLTLDPKNAGRSQGGRDATRGVGRHHERQAG